MKKVIAALACATFLYACTEAGDGSEVKEDGVGKDTMTTVNSGSGASSNDTSMYERMPTRTAGDTTVH
ncbi:MAG: hypothetical protein EOO04_09025 [Chitinophagaceae bacterium]|nr:MAG: hypothetical protein EOO04_09025 [Chitinophagaceae bacterium]